MKKLLSLLLCAALIFTCALPASAAGGFSDVKSGSWYYSDVTAMTQAGWLVGYKDGTFRPNRTISAAEFVAVVTRCAGLPEGAGQTSHWAAGELQAALDSGWYDWDEIPPTGEKHNKPISRELAVKILMKALLPSARGEYSEQAPKIRDLSTLDGRYYEAVFAAYAEGIVLGDTHGNFLAKSGLTRAQACALIRRATQKAGISEAPAPEEEPTEPIQGGVSENGRLRVEGTTLCNERGEPIVLRGMSSHGVQWYSQFTSKQSIENTASYGANLFRVAMYTAENGYISNPTSIMNKTIQAVEAAIANDMYVIIDWHILSDGNPMTYIEQAKSFFSQMAERYGDEPAVLFEICNEPNGNVSWAGDIKPYAEQIISVIREKAPNSVILIGSGTWSQDIHHAAADPVKGENLMYTCHFYAGTHGQWLRDRMDAALKSGLPLFVSEWGTSSADGSGGVFLNESKIWLDFLDSRGISWANWSLCDKNETSAALKPGTSPNAVWTDSDLSASGKFVFGRFRG